MTVLDRNTSCHRSYCCNISKSYFSAVLEPLLFFACDHCPAISRKGNRNFTSYQVSDISHIRCANTAYFSPLHLYTSGAHRQMHLHAQTYITWMHIFILHLRTWACAHMATSLPPVLSAQQHWAPFPPSLRSRRGCQNVSTATLLLNSVQHCWYLDQFSRTYAALLSKHIC